MKKQLIKILFVLSLILLFSNTCIAQEDFKSLMKYDIKGISVNNKLICPINGFTHGTVDYGIYKQRGFYFAIINDNALFGNNISLLETINVEDLNDSNIKGINCTLVDMDPAQQTFYKGKFWEKEGIVYLVLSVEDDKENTMVYIMTPQTKK